MTSHSPVETPQAATPAPIKRKRQGAQESIAPRIAGSYQRQKTANACLVCRARKTKCDNDWPVCGFCKKTGGECQYAESTSLRFDQASLAILKQLDRMETILQNHPAQVTIGGAIAAVSSPHDISVDAATPVYSRASDRRDSRTPGGHSVHQVADVSRISPLKVSDIDAPPGSDVISKASSEMGLDAMLSWPFFEERLSSIGLSYKTTLIQLLGAVSSGFDCSVDDDEIPRMTDDELRVDQDTVHQLVENFLINNNPKNPILDPIWLRRDAQEFVQRPSRRDGKACLILLVLAISSLSTPLNANTSRQRISILQDEPAFKVAELYFQESQRRIGLLYCENTLLSAQCAFLTGVYLMHTLRIMAAWKAFVQAGTQCLGYLMSKGSSSDVGNQQIHDDQATDRHLTSSSKLQAQEDGLYWSCLKSEVELRLELSLPGSGINGRKYPHVFPSVPSLEEPPPELPESPVPLSLDTDYTYLMISWFFYLGEIALRKLLYRVLVYRYGDESIENLDLAKESDLWRSVAEFDLQLQEWTQSLPLPMHFSTTSAEPLHDILPWVLRGHRIDVIEALRFPAIIAILNPSSSHLDPTSPATILLAREYLENAVNRIETNSEGLFHRHQGSWLTIRSCTRSALALLGIRLYSQHDDGLRMSLGARILPPTWKQAVLQVLDMLRAWEWESRDVERLREIIEGLLGLCLA